MVNIFPRFLIAALLLAAPAVASAQDNSSAGNTVIGPPVLSDFNLPGRVVVPAEEQPVEVPPPAPAAQRPAERAVTPPAPAAQEPQRRAAAPAPAREPAAEAPAPRPEPAGELPVFTDTPFPQPARQAPEPAPLPVEPAQESPLPGNALWIALGLALLGLLAFVAWQRSRREAVAAPAPAPIPEAPPRRPPPPAPKPVTAAEEATRPRIEMEFRPERMVATDGEVTVHFELLVSNAGQSPARDLRIQLRMFNPSADQKKEIGIFFSTPVQATADAITIPPGRGARIRHSVALPRSRVKEIEVQGRPIFVPTVAVNIVYEWGEGRKGQTSRSWVVGTETPASEKMGPFRLDLGPRIYRKVGGRPIDVARAV